MIDNERAILELRTKSLRERLIPAPEWFKRFRELECSGPVDLLLAPEANSKLGEYWMVPYPYEVPIYVRYFQSRFQNRSVIGSDEIAELEPEDYQRMIRLIQKRVDSFVEGMIHEDSLSLIDSIEDYGVIINGTTGRIHPFVYSGVDHIEMVNVPVACEYNMLCLTDMPDADEKRERLIELYDDRYDLNAWIMPVFTNDDGDKFNLATNHVTSWSITESAHMKPEDYIAIMDYINECMALRFKVMMVP